jgi:hypothetical protein
MEIIDFICPGKKCSRLPSTGIYRLSDASKGILE